MTSKTARVLQEAGLKKTSGRELVLQTLYTANRPLSYQEIISANGSISLNKVTIYRMLEILHTAGLLHKVIGSDGVWRYSAHSSAEHESCAGNHIHFFCGKCQQMCCLPESPLPWIPPPTGAVIHSKQLLVNGYCASCAPKSSPKRPVKLK